MRKDTATITAELLKKLRRRENWGGRHTALDNAIKGVPSHLRGEMRETAEELIKEGLLLSHPTGYGIQVSLNPQRKAEIDRIIKEVLGEEPNP